MNADADSSPQVAAVRVVSGNPTDAELAAVIAVLSAAADEETSDAAAATVVRPSAWALSQRQLRVWSHDSRWS